MDSETLKNLKKTGELCRKLGLSSFKCSDFEFTVAQQALLPQTPYQKKKKIAEAAKANELNLANILEEQEKALFWSSAQIGDLQ